MAAFRSASFCLICFLICSSEAQEKITAEVGQDVTLPCKVPNNINIAAVEWIRSDQDPEYVLFYRDGHIDPDNQHPSYQNRVNLQDKEMKDGDFSLILKNVTMEDTGIYECRVFEEGKKEPISIINLEVLKPAQEIITAERGHDVILPCKVPTINIIVVEWIRPDQDPDYVLYYRDGHFDPDNQNPSYQNRVDLQDKDMKDGDVSLILKNVKKNDSGRYECRVLQGGTTRKKRSDSEPISIISLKVHQSGDQDGEDSSRGHPGAVVPFLLVSLLVVFASLGFLMYKRHMKKNPNLPVLPDETAAEQTTACATLVKAAASSEPRGSRCGPTMWSLL